MLQKNACRPVLAHARHVKTVQPSAVEDFFYSFSREVSVY